MCNKCVAINNEVSSLRLYVPYTRYYYILLYYIISVAQVQASVRSLFRLLTYTLGRDKKGLGMPLFFVRSHNKNNTMGQRSLTQELIDKYV